MTQHVTAVRRVLKQRPISYGSAAGVLRFDIRFRENFIYTLYKKNITAIISRSLLKHCPILIFFGKNIREKIWLKAMI